MSLLEDAKRLAETEPVIHNKMTSDDECAVCPGYAGHHDADCPWLSMPRIVAALEAAERVLSDCDCDPEQSVDGWRLSISLPVLRAALQGEGVPS